MFNLVILIQNQNINKLMCERVNMCCGGGGVEIVVVVAAGW